MIERTKYLYQLINTKNGFPKVITGIRRCGKSYLLKDIYTKYLKEECRVSDENILVVELDKDIDKKRGIGAIICTGEYKLKLRENLYSLPIEYI